MPRQMYDKGKIVAGLVIFVIIATFPFWYNIGKAAPAPELKLTDKAKAEKECVMSVTDMKAGHMQLLDEWRDEVVRSANRLYVNSKGKSFNMSLSNTCLDCHSNKADFCDKCHDYASVRPYCWDCHIDNPKATEEAKE
ncbi:sulfate reduction electron transfer complex DsrMKJOP subunit DsrJ [Desulfonema magnum]|uniref:Redox complex linked to DsrAB, cytochrome c subunit n=1 Tax=Desulfonema magnum TaxID=45655 RepID=A0A975GKM0_9BACT|nr:sulfate reduction electron transfer complex DsrMKJOP subunit DsrJ [Desulfonema magnum]QTA84866.1 putative redox complex linked to DsrAB, cytochrome c subunit [Desulfonema magnum]